MSQRVTIRRLLGWIVGTGDARGWDQDPGPALHLQHAEVTLNRWGAHSPRFLIPPRLPAASSLLACLPRPVLSNEEAWGMVMELYELVELGWDGWDGIIPALWHVSLLLMCYVLCSTNKSKMCLETLYIPSSILHMHSIACPTLQLNLIKFTSLPLYMYIYPGQIGFRIPLFHFQSWAVSTCQKLEKEAREERTICFIPEGAAKLRLPNRWNAPGTTGIGHKIGERDLGKEGKNKENRWKLRSVSNSLITSGQRP